VLLKVKDVYSAALFILSVISATTLLLATPLTVQAATWVDVSSQLTIDTSNPIRNRRDPNATVTVTITNSSTQALAASLRLVLGNFGPDTVSLQGASGTSAGGGDPYLDLSAYTGDALAPGATTGPITLVIVGGGTVNFSFFPRVEQERGPTVKIVDPATLITIGSSPVQISGTINDPNSTLTVNGAVVAHSGGGFTAAVSLEEGHNTIVARAVDAQGYEATDSISVSFDKTPPYITIENPLDGQTVNIASIPVSGLVNDIVRGTVSESQANVQVNGVQASVANRSYLAENIALVEGANTITVSAADQVGNTASISISITYTPPAPKHIELVSGQNQSASIRTALASPLVVKLLESDGQPGVSKNVVFRVSQGDGVVGVGTAVEAQGVLVQTDANGVAQTSFRLGSRSGNGNHRVRAKAVGYDGEVVFHASATTNPGDKVSVNSGNNQRGGINQPLPQPFVAVVTDAGANVVQNAQVEFKVTKGSGWFQNNASSYITQTDSDGRATAHMTLGSEAGLDVQRVSAILVGTSLNSIFTASGFVPADPGNTRVSGIVMDNQDSPLPGVTMRVDGTTRQAVSDAQGQFTITEVPVGPIHLLADGSTTTVPGEWPTLSYNIVTIAGVDNPLASPIYMVKLDTANAVWAGLEDVSISLPEVPGFKLEVKAGSVTFPDGKKEGLISVTPVNASKVPMAPPNGMQPQFIVTIQPAGTKFDPPAPLTLPNVDGHLPGAQVEMFSYDHDLEEFVAIGLGTVSKDGTVVKTNPGIGVIKAGWHCGAQPGGDGCCSGPAQCNDYCAKPDPGCDAGCSVDTEKPLQQQTQGDCKTATCGGSKDNPGDAPTDQPGDCVNEVCTGPPEPDDGETPSQDCMECSGGSAQPVTGHVQKREQKPDDCLVLYCDGVNEDAPTEQSVDQIPNNCQKELCNGSSETDDSDDPNEECKKCQGGSLKDDPTKPLPDAKQVTGDCQTLYCDGSTKDDETDDPTVDNVKGDCKMPVCEAPGWVYNPSDAPVDVAGDCRKPAGCTTGTVNGSPYVEARFELDQTDLPSGSDLTDSIAGDCRKPGCTYGGFSPTGLPNPADKPAGVCKSCSTAGYPTDLDGVAVPGEECKVCKNGVPTAVDKRIDQCSICDNGTRKIEAGKILTQCTYCDGAGNVVKREGPVGSGSDCVTCSNGEVVSSCGTASITLIDKRDNNTILDGETVKIGPEPSMPKFEATVDYGTGTAPQSVQWSLTSKHRRREAKQYYNSKGEAVGSPRYCEDTSIDDKDLRVELNPSASWQIHTDFNLHNSINYFGAANVDTPAEMNASVSATNAAPVNFNIHGENPLRADVKVYVDAHPKPHDYIWRIALHESTTALYNSPRMLQFNRPESAEKYRYTPNFGAPDGWGIMQRDRNDTGKDYCKDKANTENGMPVRTDWVWNWQANVTEGISVAQAKRNIVDNSVDRLRTYYQNTGNKNWVEPPATTPISSDLPEIPTITACALQGYNGFKVRVYLTAVDFIPFCMKFDQTTSTWTFVQNQNDYVESILRTAQ